MMLIGLRGYECEQYTEQEKGPLVKEGGVGKQVCGYPRQCQQKPSEEALPERLIFAPEPVKRISVAADPEPEPCRQRD